jgi:hypothetical protein
MEFKIRPSKNKKKKYDAVIKSDEGITIIPFGARGYNDFTNNNYIDAKKKREEYINRHKKNEDWNKINPASLSRFILWGNSSDINKNIKEYMKKFNLK